MQLNDGKSTFLSICEFLESYKLLESFTLREMSCVVVLKLYDTHPYFSKIRTYREVPRSRHVTCTLGGRIRICSDSDFFRGMENQISGHVIDCSQSPIFP